MVPGALGHVTLSGVLSDRRRLAGIASRAANREIQPHRTAKLGQSRFGLRARNHAEQIFSLTRFPRDAQRLRLA
jgi:hypothetical protein